ncbi:MAG: metallophosphoesterase [Alphaproteobacteria bacterium]|nr:metallophosphoesterase [Alphaproteobacteria bacterium]
MPDGGLRRPIRLLHLSDLHFGAEDVEALAQVYAFADRVRPDAVIVSGDLTQTGARREFEAARIWLKQIAGRAIVAPGNHDTPVLDVTARIFSPFDRYQRYLKEFDAVDRLVEFDGGRIRIAAINTARGVQARRNWADGVVDMDDLNAALALLSDGEEDAWRILVCHHPLVEPGHSRIAVSTRRGYEALERASAAHVDAILTGHIHDAFAHAIDTAARPMVQMGAGTLSTRLRATPPSFCVIEIDGDTLVQQVVHVEDGALEIRRNYVWAADEEPPPP